MPLKGISDGLGKADLPAVSQIEPGPGAKAAPGIQSPGLVDAQLRMSAAGSRMDNLVY